MTCTAATREHRAGIFLVQRKNRVKGWDLELGGRCCWNSLSASASSTPLRTETDMLFSIVGVNLTVFGSCAAVRDSELWVCLIMTGTRIKGLHRRARVAWNGIYFISSTLSHQSCAYPDPPALRSLGCTISFRRHRRGWNCLDAPRASEREGPGDLPKRYRAGDWNPT